MVPNNRSEDRENSQSSAGVMARKPVARPACTHTTMIRIYGDQRCQICYQLPSTGFLYLCHQDIDQDLSISNELPNKRRKLHTSRGADHESKEISLEQLELLGFSKSIVKAAKEGLYNSEQIEILKGQKVNVKENIEQSIAERGILHPRAKWIPGVLQDSLVSSGEIHGASYKPLEATAGHTDSSKQDRPSPPMPISGVSTALQRVKHSITTPHRKTLASRAFESCEFRVCHSCRPFFRDRCFVSFESALQNESPLVDKWIPQLMPVAPASLVKSLGLPKSLPKDVANQSRRLESISENDEKMQDAKSARLLNKSSSYGFRESLAKDLHKMIGESGPVAPFGRSMNQVENEITLESEDEQETVPFDLNLWRVMSDALLERAASTPLPDSDSEDESEDARDGFRGLGLSWPGDNSVMEEAGTEPEVVEGGLALTEEAFEYHSPDIITSV